MNGLLARAGLGLVAATVAVPLAVVAGLSQLPATARPSSLAVADIPAADLVRYQQAASGCPGLDWTVLAGVGEVESDHGRAPDLVSSAGALGPMQFLPGTWREAGVDGDGDGDGVRDPFNAADAIPAAARYLCGLGAGRDTPTAVAAYNFGALPACRRRALAPGGYARSVLAWAARYASPPGPASPLAAVAVQAALRQVGTPYLWGGERPGGFDCSGLVQWAYGQAGLALPRVAQQQHDAGARLPAGAALLPGDLVFFGGSPRDVSHVGIYLSDGRMVDAPHTGALVRVEPVAGFRPRFLGAGRPTGPASDAGLADPAQRGPLAVPDGGAR